MTRFIIASFGGRHGGHGRKPALFPPQGASRYFHRVTDHPIRIATRGSPLALAQAHEVRRRLAERHPDLADPEAVSIAIFKTTGDRIQDRALSEIGGKGLFTKEIEDALLSGAADMAVHSMKDVPTETPPGLVIDCLLPREDPRDAWISRSGAGLSALPAGAVIGTASLRRAAQVLHRRPDLTVVPLRGNVETRLRKLGDGAVDATLLAMAGLNRLGRADVATAILSVDACLPALAQGAVGVQCRADDARCRGLLAPLDHRETALAVAAERALLARLDGSCRTPIAGLATLTEPGRLHLEGLVAQPDGSRLFRLAAEGPAADGVALGTALADRLLAAAGPDFLAEI